MNNLTTYKAVTKSHLTSRCGWVALATAGVIFITGAWCYGVSRSSLDDLAKRSNQIATDFMSQTINDRLEWEYFGRWADENKRKEFLGQATTASNVLGEILLQQRKIRSEIENSSAEDWEARYGTSGIWDALGADLFNTACLKAQVDYCKASASETVARRKILNQTLDTFGVLPKSMRDEPWAVLMRAKTYSLLARSDADGSGDRAMAMELFRKITTRTDLAAEVYYPAMIGLYQVEIPSSAAIEAMAQRMSTTTVCDNMEANLMLGILDKQAGSSVLLEKAGARWPEAMEIIGNIMLDSLGAGGAAGMSKFEMGAAAKAAIKRGPAACGYFVKLARQPGHGAVFAAAATAIEANSPIQAGQYYLNAAKSDDESASERAQWAKRAAIIGYKLSEDGAGCNLAKEGFDEYFKLELKEPDEAMEYSYAQVLGKCGLAAEEIKALKKIATKPGHAYADHARYDLLDKALGMAKANEAKFKVASGLLMLADEPGVAQQIRTAAGVLYCKSMLATGEPNAAAAVDKFIDGPGSFVPQPESKMYKAKAKFVLGETVESAEILGTLKSDLCRARAIALEVVSEYVENLDKHLAATREPSKEMQIISDLATQLKNCGGEKDMNLTAACYAIAAMKGGGDVNDLIAQCQAQIKESGQSWEMLTSMGRLEMAANDWAGAALTWARCAGGVKADCERWWMAKYYECFSLANKQGVNKSDLLHSVEVTLSSYKNAPALWQVKFEDLKKQLL